MPENEKLYYSIVVEKDGTEQLYEDARGPFITSSIHTANGFNRRNSSHPKLGRVVQVRVQIVQD